MKHTIELQPGDTAEISVAVSVPVPPDPPVPEPPIVKSPIGLNLDRPWESNRDMMFTDMFKLARYTSGTLGADGWPTGDFNLRVISNEEAANAGTGVHYPDDTGDYPFVAYGQGKVYAAGAHVEEQQYSGGWTYATIRRDDNTKNMDIGMRDCVGPIRYIAIYRPGYGNLSGTFTNEIKAIVKSGVAFRCMNPEETNVDSDLLEARAKVVGPDNVMNWADRPKVSDQNWTSPFGVPVEIMVQLAKETGVSPYINITNYAGSDYWSNLAKLCHDEIPEIPVYLAYSNETWQRGRKDFYQGTQVEAAAKAYLGTPSLQDPRYGGANEWYAAQRYTLAQTYKIADAFRAVYGDAAMNKTVRVVYECQSSQPALAADTLAWAWHVYPKPPSHYLWGLMSAPYYGSDVADTGTKQEIIDGVWRGLNNKVGWLDTGRGVNSWECRYYSIAQAYNLKWGCYENSLDIGGTSNRANKFAACYDPEAEDFTIANIALCMANGCALYMYYKATSAYGEHTFGATDDATKLDNPRFAGIRRAAQTDPRRFELRKFDPARPITGIGISPANAFLGDGTGLKATYQYKENGVIKAHTRIDPVIQLWQVGYDTGCPVPRMDITDNAHKDWNVTWSGWFIPEYTGVHRISFEGSWASMTFTINGAIGSISQMLTAGTPVPISITMFSKSGEGKIRFWCEVDGVKRLVKTSQLRPAI